MWKSAKGAAMTRYPEAVSASLRKHWKTGFDRGHDDAKGGRRADIQPAYGYKAGYEAHKNERCDCYHSLEPPATIATIKLAGGAYTMNRALRSHWTENANLTKCVRQATSRLWVEVLKGRRMVTPVRVVVHQVLVEGRKAQDIGACFPAAKAALDGLVDAGGLPDDSPEYVRELAFQQHGWKPDPPETMIVTALSVSA